MNAITLSVAHKRRFLGATKHLHNWLCPSVGWLVGRLVGWSVTHSFDDPHVAPIGLLGLVELRAVFSRGQATL